MAEYIKREAVLRTVQGQRSPCRSPAQNRMLDCLKADVIRISAADVAPIEALERLRDEMCAQDLITMEGLRSMGLHFTESGIDVLQLRREKGRRG